MTPSGIVEATERLYRSLFTAAVGFGVAMAAWGLVIAPFNGFNDHHGRSVVVGLALLVVTGAGFVRRERLYDLLRERQAWLLAAVLIGVAVLWIDGGWRSSYYLLSYTAIVLAAVTAGLRWSLICAVGLVIGYITGLAVNGYSWSELKALNDADSIVANSGGYLIAAGFFALPVAWLGGYVVRINQVVGTSPTAQDEPAAVPRRLRTKALTVREVEVAQLVSAGMTSEEIAQRLFLSPRTIQSHIQSAMRKTGAKNRAELAALAVREGLVPVAGRLDPENP